MVMMVLMITMIDNDYESDDDVSMSIDDDDGND